MVQTSSSQHSQTIAQHRIALQAGGITKTALLPTPSGGIVQGKGDLWKLSLETDIGFTECITLKDIQNMSIQEDGDDGWRIDSIVTFLVVDPYYWAMSSADFDVNRWIDGDSNSSAKEFILTLYA